VDETTSLKAEIERLQLQIGSLNANTTKLEEDKIAYEKNLEEARRDAQTFREFGDRLKLDNEDLRKRLQLLEEQLQDAKMMRSSIKGQPSRVMHDSLPGRSNALLTDMTTSMRKKLNLPKPKQMEIQEIKEETEGKKIKHEEPEINKSQSTNQEPIQKKLSFNSLFDDSYSPKKKPEKIDMSTAQNISQLFKSKKKEMEEKGVGTEQEQVLPVNMMTSQKNVLVEEPIKRVLDPKYIFNIFL